MSRVPCPPAVSASRPRVLNKFLTAFSVFSFCSKHARRHPNFDPSVLRQRRAPTKASSVNSSEGTLSLSEGSSESAPSP